MAHVSSFSVVHEECLGVWGSFVTEYSRTPNNLVQFQLFTKHCSHGPLRNVECHKYFSVFIAFGQVFLPRIHTVLTKYN